MKLDHIAIVTGDPRSSAAWYRERFQAEVLYLDDTWAMLQIGDTKLALTVPHQHPAHIAFTVASEDQMPKAEVKTHRDGSKYVYEHDPDGNVIEYIFWPQGS